MAEVLFYHLERQTLEEVLPVLLERCLERGWRTVVEVSDAAVRDALDRHLWTYRDDSFLPHGTAADGRAAEQPIYLATSAENPNAARVRVLADRAAPGEISDYERVVLMFSADDPPSVAAARRHWKPLQAAGHECTYWRQSSGGRWERKG